MAVVLVPIALILNNIVAEPSSCTVYVPPNAQAYVQEGDFGPMVPAAQSKIGQPGFTADVEDIDGITPGGPWVAPTRHGYYRQDDVVLRGDCESVQRE